MTVFRYCSHSSDIGLVIVRALVYLTHLQNTDIPQLLTYLYDLLLHLTCLYTHCYYSYSLNLQEMLQFSVYTTL